MKIWSVPDELSGTLQASSPFGAQVARLWTLDGMKSTFGVPHLVTKTNVKTPSLNILMARFLLVISLAFFLWPEDWDDDSAEPAGPSHSTLESNHSLPMPDADIACIFSCSSILHTAGHLMEEYEFTNRCLPLQRLGEE